MGKQRLVEKVDICFCEKLNSCFGRKKEITTPFTSDLVLYDCFAGRNRFCGIPRRYGPGWTSGKKCFMELNNCACRKPRDPKTSVVGR